MEKSEYGKELVFYSKAFRRLKDVEIEVTGSTFNINEHYKKMVKNSWDDAKKKNPNIFDAGKWRLELVHEKKDTTRISVSGGISYSQHNVLRHVKCALRHEEGMPIGFYPNPLTINVIQETTDGYILLGKRGKGSDQKNIAFVGGGFVEKYDKDTTPEKLGFVMQKECMEETKYRRKLSFNMNKANVLGIVFGSNHDTSVISHLPIFGKKEDVDINGDEFDEIIYLPNNEKDIMEVLESGKLEGIELADHALGCLELYLKHKKAGLI